MRELSSLSRPTSLGLEARERGMKVYRSNQPERLAAALAEILAPGRGAPADPLVPELVVVGSQGMERWLTQQIAQRVGVCAGIDFPFPGQLVQRVFAAALGQDLQGLAAWTPDRLTWYVLDLLPGLVGEPAFAPLSAYLGRDANSPVVTRRRLQLARRIADTFDRYVAHRPQMVLEWQAGQGDPADWQPALWRALVERIDSPHLAALAEALNQKMSRPGLDLPGMPERVFLFGVSTLPPFHVEVLGALARHREVHLFVPSPARDYWALMRTEREAERLTRLTGRTREELHIENLPPLLDSFGRLYRDFQGILLDRVEYEEPLGEALFHSPESGTMLHVLQRDVLDLVTRGEPLANALPPLEVDLDQDRSIQVHACHGPMRQVEVLRDALLELFDTEADLEPRDVVVMTPDLDTFAPLVDAVFADGSTDIAGFPRIPFQIADRSLRSVNPVAEALLSVLEVAQGRLGASEVMDLLSLEAIRDTFGVTLDDLPQLWHWIGTSGIAWGIDEAHREELGQPRRRENTWRFGLERLFLGLALRGEGRQLFDGVLPCDEMEGAETVLLGSLAELVERLITVARMLRKPRPIQGWAEVLTLALASLVDCSGERSGYARRVRLEIEALVSDGGVSRNDDHLELAALLAWLTGRFEASTSLGGFLGGQVTLCSMIPMRTIPFKVVCLLGMDDSVFPRSLVRVSFDKVEQSPRRGDRTRRDDDRSIFLEAILAARRHLIITYTGRSLTTNGPIAPAVPVGELLDVFDAAFDCGQGRRTRDLLTRVHPLQSFSPRCFGVVPGQPDAEPNSFDRRTLSGAKRLHEARLATTQETTAPLLDRPLAMPQLEVATLDVLIRFLRSPLEWFLRNRLSLRLEVEGEHRADREPIQLDGLQKHAIGTDLVDWELAEQDPSQTFEAVRASGRLSLGTPGRLLFENLREDASTVARAAARLRSGAPREPVDIDLQLDSIRLTGSIGGLTERGLLRWQYGRVKADQRLGLWVHHLALCASGLHFPEPSRLVGRHKTGGHEVVELPMLDKHEALGHLEQLVGLFLRGQRAPIAFFPGASRAYAVAWLTAVAAAEDGGSDPEQALEKARRAAADPWRKTGFGTHEDHGEGVNVWVDRVVDDPGVAPSDPRFELAGLDSCLLPSFHDLALLVWRPMWELNAAGGDG